MTTRAATFYKSKYLINTNSSKTILSPSEMTKDRLKVTEKLYKEKPQIENTGFAVCRNFPYSHFASF